MGPNQERDYLMQDGLWGWADGEGCRNRADAIEIAENWADVYAEGNKVSRWKFVSRGMTDRESGGGTGGKIDGAIWIYIAPDPEDVTTLSRHTQKFVVDRRLGKVHGLIATGHLSILRDVGADSIRLRNPRAGQRIRPCAANAETSAQAD